MFSLVTSFSDSISTQFSQVETGHISHETSICCLLLEEQGDPELLFSLIPSSMALGLLSTALSVPQGGKERMSHGPHRHTAPGNFICTDVHGIPSAAWPRSLCLLFPYKHLRSSSCFALSTAGHGEVSLFSLVSLLQTLIRLLSVCP